MGIEPTTIRLKVECSTAELPARRAGDSVKPMPREAARNIGGQGYGRKPLARAGIYLFCAYIGTMNHTTRAAMIFALALLILTQWARPDVGYAKVPEATEATAEAKASTPSPVQGPAKDTLGEAMTAPLEDLNLTKDKIPPVLELAMTGPYEAPQDQTCEGLAAEIAPLTLALGPDLDVPPSKTNRGLLERSSTFAGDAAIGAVRGAAEGLIPFRGLVRKVSGAETHAKKVRAAIAAGAVRRAYLKGLGEAKGCAAPAAPQRTPTAPVDLVQTAQPPQP